MQHRYPRRNLTHWVTEQLDQGIRRALCLFSGTSAQAQAFKRKGIAVDTWDPFLCHQRWSKALVENNKQTVPQNISSQWLHLIKDPKVAKRFSPWAVHHFTPEEAIWLGIWRTHLDSVEDDYQRALGEIAVFWTMNYWHSLNDQDYEYKPLIPVAAFRHYLALANSRVFDNHATNRTLEDPFADTSHDLMYCYLPARQGVAGERSIVSLWESWLAGKPDYQPQDAWNSEEGYLKALQDFFRQGEKIPYWAIACNDSEVDRDALTRMISELRPVIRLKEMAVPYPSASGSGIIRETFLLAARG